MKNLSCVCWPCYHFAISNYAILMIIMIIMILRTQIRIWINGLILVCLLSSLDTTLIRRFQFCYVVLWVIKMSFRWIKIDKVVFIRNIVCVYGKVIDWLIDAYNDNTHFPFVWVQLVLNQWALSMQICTETGLIIVIRVEVH